MNFVSIHPIGIVYFTKILNVNNTGKTNFKLRCPKYSNAASCENCKCTHKMPSLAFSIRCFNKLNFYHMNLYLSTEFVFSLHMYYCNYGVYTFVGPDVLFNL